MVGDQILEDQRPDGDEEAWDEVSPAVPTSVATHEFDDFLPAVDEDGHPSGTGGIDMLLNVSLEVSVELGRTRMTIGEVLGLRATSVIELDKVAGEPSDIFVNGTKIARGEVVVVDDKFGVRVTEVAPQANRVASLG